MYRMKSGVSIEAELNVLDRNINALRIEYERFFAGDVKKPPFQSRKRVEDTLKNLRNTDVERAAERFRLNSIQSKYNSMSELWEKRLLAKEQGRVSLGAVILHPPTGPGHARAPEAEPPVRQEASPNAGASGSVEKRRVDFSPLFQRYVSAREALGEDVSKLRYERFEELVRKQAEDIKKRTGSARLVFEVQTVEGKVKLVGRAAPPKGQG